MADIDKLFRYLKAQEGSDLHLLAGLPPRRGQVVGRSFTEAGASALNEKAAVSIVVVNVPSTCKTSLLPTGEN